MFSSRAALQFLGWSVMQEKGFQWFKKFKPALTSLEISLGRSKSEIPPTIAAGCSAMMRKLAATKVRKDSTFKRLVRIQLSTNYLPA